MGISKTVLCWVPSEGTYPFASVEPIFIPFLGIWGGGEHARTHIIVGTELLTSPLNIAKGKKRLLLTLQS